MSDTTSYKDSGGHKVTDYEAVFRRRHDPERGCDLTIKTSDDENVVKNIEVKGITSNNPSKISTRIGEAAGQISEGDTVAIFLPNHRNAQEGRALAEAGIAEARRKGYVKRPIEVWFSDKTCEYYGKWRWRIMSQLGCICGKRMTKTSCPSPCSLDIFYKEEVERAVIEDPAIELHNFLSGWDERNDCPNEYMDRPEPVDYWYCPACKRVYEVQYIPGGRWLRIYKKVDDPLADGVEGWRQIYVLPDVETDAATEEDWSIRLSDYLQQHDAVLYYLSPDEKIVYAVEKASSKVAFAYELEDSWSPSSDGITDEAKNVERTNNW